MYRVSISTSLKASGMKEGDFIVSVNDNDVKWAPHDEVVTLIKASGNLLVLKLATPVKDGGPSNKDHRRPTKDRQVRPLMPFSRGAH